MIIEKTLMKFGFTKDENNSKLKEFFKNNSRLKEIHIDMYPENPLKPSTSFMLLLRTSEANAVTSNDRDRLILKRNDKYGTQFLNILFTEVAECFFNMSDGFSEFIINIQNIYYRITVLN